MYDVYLFCGDRYKCRTLRQCMSISNKLLKGKLLKWQETFYDGQFLNISLCGDTSNHMSPNIFFCLQCTTTLVLVQGADKTFVFFQVYLRKIKINPVFSQVRTGFQSIAKKPGHCSGVLALINRPNSNNGCRAKCNCELMNQMMRWWC